MYAGDVTPGGPSDVRELAALTIRKCSVGSMDNNAYLLTSTATGAQLLIDAAADAPRLTALLSEGTGSLDLVVTTHQHHDHVQALAEVVAATGARTAAGAEDADALPVPVDDRLAQGDRVRFGDITLDVLHLRGHTPGSVALAYADPGGHTHLFTGDSLFPGGVGNTKSAGQDFDALIADVSDRVFDVYDDQTWVYPGHGGDTTLGAERPHLPKWRARGW
ncbi:MBL fold metallo-hydrolase [Lapillicoccus sp.]|uniref:MBL fold metallo-hydrolase n=1 Tax=Lapillicoccus sp. TaxID=1909287 RepID=UPI003983B69E